MAYEDERNLYTVESGEACEVHIADEVLAVMAGLAATEIDGVASLGGNITADMIGKHGIKGLSRGVRLQVEDKEVTVKLELNLEGVRNIPEVCGKVQDRVKTALENMTGFQVKAVNISVLDVSME